MAKVGIVMGSDSDMPVMSKAADVLRKLGVDFEMTIISAHREPDVFFDYAKRESSAFAGYVCGDLSAAGHRRSDENFRSRRSRLPVFHRADAQRHSGGDSSHQRRGQCGDSGGEDSGGIRSGAFRAAEGIFGRDEKGSGRKSGKAG